MTAAAQQTLFAVTAPIIMTIGRKSYGVASFEEASKLFCKARDRGGQGASRINPPVLSDAAAKVIGYVSYNGRVWEGEARDWNSGTRCLFDPQGAA